MCRFPDQSLAVPTLICEEGTSAQWARELLTQLNVPNTALTTASTQLARQVSPEWLFNHCVRSFLFAEQIGKLDNNGFDPELLYVATMLHDLGLTKAAEGQGRFEIDGAEVAYRFVMERGFTEEKANVLWDAIALHSSIGVGDRHPCTEVRLVYQGVFLDGLGGVRVQELPSAFFDATFAAFPRLNSLSESIEAMVSQVRKDPRKAPPFTMHAALAEALIPGYKTLNIMNFMSTDFWERFN